jgi:hypothetical protein
VKVSGEKMAQGAQTEGAQTFVFSPPPPSFPQRHTVSVGTALDLNQGRRKHQKIGVAPASRGTLGYRKGHLKKFSQRCWRRGRGKKKFSRRSIPKLHVFDQIF